MSLATWLEEASPVPANDPSIKNDRDAILHSLRKWKCLRKECLDRHGVEADGKILRDPKTGSKYFVDSGTCALCVKHPDCSSCPLLKIRGVKCYETIYNLPYSPYGKFTIKCDPEPMIKLLTIALERLQCTLLPDTKNDHTKDVDKHLAECIEDLLNRETKMINCYITLVKPGKTMVKLCSFHSLAEA